MRLDRGATWGHRRATSRRPAEGPAKGWLAEESRHRPHVGKVGKKYYERPYKPRREQVASAEAGKSLFWGSVSASQFSLRISRG
jgi:hypothetical protein